jgi:hypothetical protein
MTLLPRPGGTVVSSIILLDTNKPKERPLYQNPTEGLYVPWFSI